MLVGAMHGYPDLISWLVAELRREMISPRLPVGARGGYARLMAAKFSDISWNESNLTLEGLQLVRGRPRSGMTSNYPHLSPPRLGCCR